MESAYLRNVEDLQFLSDKPINFVRVPKIGETVFLPPILYQVKEVIHFWVDGAPFIEVRIQAVSTIADSEAFKLYKPGV